MKKKKTLLIVAGTILTIILVAVISISVIANKNVKAMDSCVNSVLKELEQNYTVTPVDVGEYKEMTVYGIMKY